MLAFQTPHALLEAMLKLRDDVQNNCDEVVAGWLPLIERPAFGDSARNLASYLALRRHDLRDLQLALMRWGLSSLGRSESRVQATLDAVIATLGAMCDADPTTLPAHADEEAFFQGSRIIAREANKLFGPVYSFVQAEEDVALFVNELAQRLPPGRPSPALVLKIETKQAVQNLPGLIVQAGGKVPVAVMIARGDLAIELGFQRIAEMQEEILWLCEAAYTPVIWATQVLETLAKDGLPTRAEVTDAAMANRAECVMLNKGPHIVQAVQMLDDVLTRMAGHQLKKTPQLRALRSWQAVFSEEEVYAPMVDTMLTSISE